MVYGRDDLLALWVADMEFAIAPEILSKIKERIEHPIFGYNYKDDTQYSNFINYVEEHHDWKLDPSWLQMSPGIVPAINFMVKIFTNPGQRILIQQPVYTPFKDAVTANDRTLVVNNLIETDGYYTIDFDDLDKKLENCKILDRKSVV